MDVKEILNGGEATAVQEPPAGEAVGYETEDYRDAVAMARLVLARPGDVAEVRVLGTPLGTKGMAAGWFDDPEKLARRALQFSGHAKGVYVTLNPVKPEPLGRTSNRIKQGQKPTTVDGDVACRRRLLIDADPDRPPDTNATDAEKEAARRKIEAV